MALIGALLAAVVFAPIPGRAVWLSKLHDFAHGPIFGCVALLALAVVRGAGGWLGRGALAQYAFALAVAAALGLATEAAQLLVGRDASWGDFGRDVLGAGSFLAAFAAFDPATRGSGRSLLRGAALASAVAGLGYLATPVLQAAAKYYERSRAFPVIADFSQKVDVYFIARNAALIEHTLLPQGVAAVRGERAARVRFLQGQYPGVEFLEPAPDWRGYSALAVEAVNPTAHALKLVVRVHDAHHTHAFTDRYNRSCTLAAASRGICRFPLADVERAPRGRRMDLQRIAGLVVFRADESAAREMYLVRLWLE